MIFTFNWQATDSSGVRRHGASEGFSDEEVRERLRRRGFRTIVITSRSSSFTRILRHRVKRSSLAAFARSLRTMIAAGMIVSEALAILAEQEEDRELARVLLSLHDEVKGGMTFSRAIASHPHVFDPFFVSLASVGENGGNLKGALERIAHQMEVGEKLSKEIKTAMSYPLAVLGVTLGLLVVMLAFVIPSFEKMFGAVPLPLPTRILLYTSRYFQAHWLSTVLGGVVTFLVAAFAVTTPRGRMAWDGAMLRLPLVGAMLKKSAVSRTTRAMSLMTASGMLAVDALSIAAGTIGNAVIRESLLDATRDVVGGRSIAAPLRATGVFSPMAVGLIAVGETTKSLPENLRVVADFYDGEISALATSISGLVEPVMTVLIGILVGGMLLAMYLPIFRVVGTIG